MIKRLLTSKLFTGAAAFSLATSAQAASIAVLNGDFNIVPTTYYGDVPGWTQLAGADADVGFQAYSFTSGLGWDGTRAAYSNGPSIGSDALTTLAADSIYTLTLQVGRRPSVPGIPQVQFYAGATLMTPSSTGINSLPGSGAFETWTFVYNMADPINIGLIGQTATVQLSKVAGSVQAGFDNVTLDVVPVPETSTGVLALGALGLMLRRKRR
jgi:hypothetical protein